MASTTEIVDKCHAFVAKDKKDIDGLEAYLKKHSDFFTNLVGGAWSNFFEALIKATSRVVGEEPIFTHTFAVTWVLGAAAVNKDERLAGQLVAAYGEPLFQQGNFAVLNGRDAVLSRLKDVEHRYAAAMRAADKHRRGTHFLRLAIDRFRPAADHLTPAHSDVVMLAVQGQNPRACLDLLALPIFEVNPSATGVAALEYMTYYYYGALAYTALHKWSEAIDFLNNVLVVPANAVSTVMIAAYKTLLLVSTIASGTTASLPANFTAGLEKVLKTSCTEYVELAAAFEGGDAAKFQAAVDAGMTAFKADNQLGLVQQAVRAVKKQHIVRLTRIYVTLSITQIAQMVETPVAEVSVLLREMIVTGMVRAVIDVQDGTVSFDTANGAADALDAQGIERRMARAEDLVQRIRDKNEDVLVSKGYVTRQLRDLPNLREELHEFELKQKKASSSSVLDVFSGRL